MYEEKIVDLQGISQVIGLEGTNEGPLMIMLHGGPWGRLYMDTLFAIIIQYFIRTADLCSGISMDAAETMQGM